MRPSSQAQAPGIWLAGALLATMGAGGALLTLGLVQRWGEVYPRWIPYLRGKPVRPRTAIVPASLVAILITSAGLMYVRWFLLGRFRLTSETWGLFLPRAVSGPSGAPPWARPRSPTTFGDGARVAVAADRDRAQYEREGVCLGGPGRRGRHRRLGAVPRRRRRLRAGPGTVAGRGERGD